MHLARPNFCTKGSGVWGDKSQVLFVNDKAIISLVLHREKKKNLTAKIQTRIPRETTELVAWKSFFFFFPSREQTNGPLRATDLLRRSYWQTHWQPAPKEVLSNLRREAAGKRMEGWKKDTKWEERKKKKGGKNKSKLKVKRQERDQRGWRWDERKDKLGLPQQSSN